MLPPVTIDQAITGLVREEWGRILASLTKSLSDLQLAEDALQDAVEAALIHWPEKGLPDAPAAWLIKTARRKAIDRLRRMQNFTAKSADIAYLIEIDTTTGMDDFEVIEDERLSMIFTCCHPSLDDKTQIALTLRTIGGLTTEEIALSFLDSPAAMAKRLTRGKSKIRGAGIPYAVPAEDELPDRINKVLAVVYLIFNEGYKASRGETLMRTSLSDEAIRLARILHQMLPLEVEISGLLALMLLHDSRRNARSDKAGNMIPLEQQNRSRWDQAKIREGINLVKTTLAKQRVGPYQIQAAISALHAEAACWQETDWPQILALYRLLDQMTPSSVIKINQAIACSYAHSPQEALRLLESITVTAELEGYQPYFAAKSDILRRADQFEAAVDCLKRAISLSENEASRGFLTKKLESWSEE